MRARAWTDLIIINLLTFLLIIAIIAFPSNVLRIILGIPFVLLFPGYILMATLFPRKDRLSSMERVALSFGLSIAVVPLVGLALNYSPWGIVLESLLFSVAGFIVIMSAIAWVRRAKLPDQERFRVKFGLRVPWQTESTLGKSLSILLVVFAIAVLGTLGYAIARPGVGEKFTEFYILGVGGKADNYPTELVVGETGHVVVGIISQEQATTSYRLEVRVDGTRNSEVGPIVLEYEEKWEERIDFFSVNPGDDQKIEFFLFKGGETEPSQEPLHLWIDAIE